MPFFSPVSAGGIPKATYTATTGSPTIDTASRAGKTIIKYTGSGSITVGTAGTCEVLVVAGGGGGVTSGGSSATGGNGGSGSGGGSSGNTNSGGGGGGTGYSLNSGYAGSGGSGYVVIVLG